METSVKPPTSLRPLTWVLLIALVCLLPFINKPFHIDDPLFLRAAAQIQRHPADFYGFTMNWLGTPLPMVKDFDNPPLTGYYLALAAAVIGWSETALHLAFLLPALASAWGIFALARRFSRHPLLAAVIAVLTPVFLISATTLMCDVMCLAFWVWAVVTFERGLEHNDWKWLLAAGGIGRAGDTDQVHRVGAGAVAGVLCIGAPAETRPMAGSAVNPRALRGSL